MGYKAIVYEKPRLKFEITEASDVEVNGWPGMVSFFGPGGSGRKAYGKTKEIAIQKLKEGIISDIKNLESKIADRKKLLKKIK